MDAEPSTGLAAQAGLGGPDPLLPWEGVRRRHVPLLRKALERLCHVPVADGHSRASQPNYRIKCGQVGCGRKSQK